MMEWNAKPHLQWDSWENDIIPLPSRATEENLKILQPPDGDWGIDTDEQIASGSLVSRLGGGYGSGLMISGGTSFDRGYASHVSKSSKSSSMTSPSTEDVKFYNFSVEEAHRSYPEKMIEVSGSSPTIVESSSVCSGEPLLSLKLGKRAYFKDISDAPIVISPPDTSASAKRMKKTAGQNTRTTPLCQVEGCHTDLSSSKDYHRKHRVCEAHTKSPMVVVNGVERRFCQQCSRFHGLEEFDENRRSCRKRLSDHNARRRKPHSDLVHYNPSRLSTIIYGDGLRTVNPVLFPWNAVSSGSCGLPPIKILGGGGSEGSVISSAMNAPQDLQRALSLLSTDTRDSSYRPRFTAPHPDPLHLQLQAKANHVEASYGISQSSSSSSALGSTMQLCDEQRQWLGAADNSQRSSSSHDNRSNNDANFHECLNQHDFGFDMMHHLS